MSTLAAGGHQGRPLPMLSVALVEDERLTRNNLVALIARTPGLRCVGAYPSAEQALEALPPVAPDVVLMDLHLPGLSGVECARRLRTALPALKIVVLTKFEEAEEIFEALKAGANGCLSKQVPPEELLAAVRSAHAGEAPISAQIARRMVEYFHREPVPSPPETKLTPRERQVLVLLSRGFLYKEIAQELGIGYVTVNSHTKSLYDKLHVRSRAEAVARFLPQPQRGR